MGKKRLYGKLDAEAIGRIRRAIALFCLSAAGIYYALCGRKAEQAKPGGTMFVEAEGNAGFPLTPSGGHGTEGIAGTGRAEEQFAETSSVAEEAAARAAGSGDAAGRTDESIAVPTVQTEPGSVGQDTMTADTAPAGDSAALTGAEKQGEGQPKGGNTAPTGQDGLIDLNSATLEELDTLPGIGPATARLIVEYRETYGGFAEPAEIKNVKRIGDKTFDKIKHLITVR